MAPCKWPGMGAWLFGLATVVIAAHATIPASLYSKTVGANYMFYETQIAGERPDWAKVTWRQKSHTSDGFGNSDGATFPYPDVDLSGGWFENGGYIKVSLTTGATASLLAYGSLTWEQALRAAGEWDYAVQNLRSVADYFVKTFFSDGGDGNFFVAQVGDQYTDDRVWMAPEVQFPEGSSGGEEGSGNWRPVYKVSASNKRGADAMGQAVAALAAAGLMLKRAGPYSENSDGGEYYQKAVDMYSFIVNNNVEGVFIVPDGNITVLSRTYRDDLTWAAGWLCRWQLESNVDRDNADANYCQAAAERWTSQQKLRGMQPWLTTDNMYLATGLLLRDLVEMGAYELNPNLLDYEAMIDQAFTWWDTAAGNACNGCEDVGLCKTADGFMVLQKHGSAHFTANMAFVALASVPRPREAVRNGGDARPYHRYKTNRICWAKSQIDYLLGSNSKNQAYVTGLSPSSHGLPSGINVPMKARHRASACDGTTCVPPSEANPNILIGALIGGPDASDNFEDSRNSVQNLVSIEYNAGFAGAALGLAALSAVKPVGTSWSEYCGASAPDATYEATSGLVTQLDAPEEGTTCPTSCVTPSDSSKSCGLFMGSFNIDGARKYLSCNALYSKDLKRKIVLNDDGTLNFYNYDKVTGVSTYTGGNYPSNVYIMSVLNGPYTSLALRLGADGYLTIEAQNESGESASYVLPSAQNDNLDVSGTNVPYTALVLTTQETLEVRGQAMQLSFTSS